MVPCLCSYAWGVEAWLEMVKMRLKSAHMQNVTLASHRVHFMGAFHVVSVGEWLQQMVKMRFQICHFVNVMLLKNVPGFDKQ